MGAYPGEKSYYSKIFTVKNSRGLDYPFFIFVENLPNSVEKCKCLWKTRGLSVNFRAQN